MADTPRSRAGGLSLGAKIFGLTALLLILAVGTALLVTSLRGQAIAQQAVVDDLERSAESQEIFQDIYLDRLFLLSNSLVQDPDTMAYVTTAADAETGPDLPSLFDLFDENQQILGYDFVAVLRNDGRLVMRSDDRTVDDTEVRDYSDRPLVAAAMGDELGEAVTGIWREDDALYTAVAEPVVVGFDIWGYIVMGFRIDEIYARDLREVSGTPVVFFATSGEGLKVVQQSIGDADVRPGEVMSALDAENAMLDAMAVEEGKRFEIELGGQPWSVLLRPLRDAAGEPVGGVAALVSLDRKLKPYRDLQRLLLVVGIGTVLGALLLSFALSRRTLGPIQRLLEGVEGASQGDYDQNIPVERGDEVGRLAQGFNDLMGDLRQRRDMESYLADLSKTLPEPARPVAAAATGARPLTLMGVEMRRFSRPGVVEDPDETARLVSRDLRRVTQSVVQRGGRLESSLGHRLLATFAGLDRERHALAAAREIATLLAQPTNAFDDPAPPLVALAGGRVVTGAVFTAGANASTVVGMPVQMLEGLLREATPGEILMTADVYQALETHFDAADLSLDRQRGVITPLPLYAVDLEQATQVVGSETSNTLADSSPADGSTLSSIAVGSTLGERFEILSILGEGGMGVVYKARDRELGDLVALKMLRGEVGRDAVQVSRLKDELRLARRITHPNVLRTYDLGELDGLVFISMEYVRGVTLRYMLDHSDRLPYSAGLRLAKQICSGLAAAHEAGIIHRDIKPENVILDPTGNAKLMDFGIARPSVRMDAGHTQEGSIIGTPRYLSPEQIEGQEVDTRVDIYSVGVVLYEVFTGSLPFSTEGSVVEILNRHLNEEPARPSMHWEAIPQPLETALLTCLAKNREDRYQRIDDLLRDLEKLAV